MVGRRQIIRNRLHFFSTFHLSTFEVFFLDFYLLKALLSCHRYDHGHSETAAAVLDANLRALLIANCYIGIFRR